MSHNIGILAPGKGWGNFVSYISCFKTISKTRKTNVFLITKEFSSAKSYLEDQEFVKKFYEIPNNKRGFFQSVKYAFKLYKILSSAKLNEIFIFHSSASLVLLSYLANIKNIYAPGIGYQNFFLKKKNKLYEKFFSKTIDPIEETNNLTKKILKIDKIDFLPLKHSTKADEKLVGICIACSGPEKQWGVENYIELINFLIKNNYNKFLLLSGMDQSNLEKTIVSNFSKPIKFINTSTKTIEEVIPNLRKCKFVIGNDTGFAHLSVAYSKKTFVILGDCPSHTYSDLILPIDKDDDVKRSIDSIKTIKLEKVLNYLNNHLI